MNTRKSKNMKLIYTALFAALVCVATSVIRIPTPGTSGYVHPGDALVILSGLTLGPIWGGLAAGIGSALSDLLGGYIIYVPITCLIKGGSAFLIGYVMKHIDKEQKKHTFMVVLASVINGVVVVGGYLSFETVLYSFPAALASVIPNLIQVGAGLVLAVVLYPLVHRIPYLRSEEL